MISVLAILALAAALVFYFQLCYLALLPIAAACGLSTIKYFERTQEEEPAQRKLIGQKCLVVRTIGKSERGIVRVYREGDGILLDSELWSAELAPNSKGELSVNQVAKVIGRQGIIYL
jgi:membrane protein implicated in regulation of membrane protease activity